MEGLESMRKIDNLPISTAHFLLPPFTPFNLLLPPPISILLLAAKHQLLFT
jgi:hypothetical protein